MIEAHAFSVTAIARNKDKIGYRTMLVRSKSKHEAIGYALDAMKEHDPGASFCEAAALEISPDTMAQLGILMQPLTLTDPPASGTRSADAPPAPRDPGTPPRA